MFFSSPVPADFSYEKNLSGLPVVHRRFAVFASYNGRGKIDNSVVLYLKNLYEAVDGIVFIADSPVIPDELCKIKDLVLCARFGRHGEYDFGSYKRGWQFLKENGLSDQADEILFCNDSIIGPFRPLNDILDEARRNRYDFYGMTINPSVFFAEEKKTVPCPHVQSFFMLVSRNIFEKPFFDEFMSGVKAQGSKDEIISRYEVGLSKLIRENGFELHSVYRNREDTGAPCLCEMMDLLKERLFIKKSILSKREYRRFDSMSKTEFKPEKLYNHFLFFKKLQLFRYNLRLKLAFGKRKAKLLERRNKLAARLARLGG